MIALAKLCFDTLRLLIKKGKTGSENREKNWFIKINWIKYENEFAYFIQNFTKFSLQNSEQKWLSIFASKEMII